MTSRVPVFLFGTDEATYCHATSRNDKIASKKQMKQKTAVYHTVNGDPALFHTSKTAKMIKVTLLSSTLTF